MAKRLHGRNGKPLHVNRLQPSKADDIALAQAVEERFLTLCKDFLRIRGVQLEVPESLMPDMMKWREMRMRHKKGDFRNTEAENKSTRAIANWTLSVKASLCDQTPKKVEWR